MIHPVLACDHPALLIIEATVSAISFVAALVSLSSVLRTTFVSPPNSIEFIC